MLGQIETHLALGAEIKGVPLLIVPSGKTAGLLRSQIYLGDI